MNNTAGAGRAIADHNPGAGGRRAVNITAAERLGRTAAAPRD